MKRKQKIVALLISTAMLFSPAGVLAETTPLGEATDEDPSIINEQPMTPTQAIDGEGIETEDALVSPVEGEEPPENESDLETPAEKPTEPTTEPVTEEPITTQAPTDAPTPTVSAMQANSSEVIVVEYARMVLWAKHSYQLPQPNAGQLPVTLWKSSRPRVASVSGGKVKARRLGKTTIRGYDQNGYLRKIVKVTVKLGRDYTLFIAHRGYCAKAPENTLPAFRNAVRAGFGGIELDVWESKTTPKKSRPCILVIHDSNLKHKTGKKMKTSKLNRGNRRKYKIRKHVRGIKRYGPQTIPTIEEALRCIYREARVQKRKNFIVEIDVKNPMSDRAVKHVIRLVGKHRVHILCANQKTLKKFKKYRRYRTTEIWYCTGNNNAKTRMKNIHRAGRAGFDGISLPFRNMNRKTIRIAKSYGMKIGGYDISSPRKVQMWAKAGCTRFNMRNRAFVR